MLNAGLRYDVFTPGDQISTVDLRERQALQGAGQPAPRHRVPDLRQGRAQLPLRLDLPDAGAQRHLREPRRRHQRSACGATPTSSPRPNIAYQAGMQHLFSRDVSGQFWRVLPGHLRSDHRAAGARRVRQPGQRATSTRDYASARGFEASLIKSFSHKFSAEVNYTYSLATGVASGSQPGAPVLQRRPALPADLRAAARLGPAPHAQRLGRDPRSRQVGRPHAVVLRLGLPVHADVPQRPPRRIPSSRTRGGSRPSSNLALDGDKYYKVWGQNVRRCSSTRATCSTSPTSRSSPGRQLPQSVHQRGG